MATGFQEVSKLLTRPIIKGSSVTKNNMRYVYCRNIFSTNVTMYHNRVGIGPMLHASGRFWRGSGTPKHVLQVIIFFCERQYFAYACCAAKMMLIFKCIFLNFD